MRLEVVTDKHQFFNLRDKWNKLLSTTNTPGLPLTHEWLFTWWQVFGHESQLNIICVYDKDKIIAIAPCIKEKLYYRGLPMSAIKFMANGHSPYCDIIFDQKLSEPQVFDIIELIIRSTPADIMQFNKTPDHSFLAKFFSQNPNTINLHYGIKASIVTPVIYIKKNWNDFIKERSRKFKKSINNKLNKFNKLTDFAINCTQIPNSGHPYLNDIVEVSKKSWKRKIKNDLGSNTSSKEFLFRLADVFGPTGLLNIWLLYNINRPVAYEYHINYSGVIYPIRADFDEEYKSISPGSILEYTAIKKLFENDSINEYYSCADDYWYLNNWTNDLKKHFTIEVFSNSWKSLVIYYFEYKIIPMLRPLLKKKHPANQF